jgi:hypothetical protein
MTISTARALVLAIAILGSTANCRAENATLPLFDVISQDVAEQRRSVAVRVARRLDDTELAQIGETVRARDKRAFTRTHVNVFLPGQSLTQGPWASVLLAPEPKVVVHGLRRDDEEMFLAEHRADRRPMLGSWLTSPPAVPGRLTIYSDAGRIYAEWRLRSGQKTLEELQDGPALKSGRRFDIPGAGFYVLTRTGELEIWDKSTLIATAERIRPDHLALPAVVALGKAGPSQSQSVAIADAARPASAGVKRETYPSSPVQPEAKAATSMPTASVTASVALVHPPVAQPAATAVTRQPVAAAVLDSPAEASLVPAGPIGKVATTKPGKSRAARTKAANAQIADRSKARTLSTGDQINAKIAGRF